MRKQEKIVGGNITWEGEKPAKEMKGKRRGEGGTEGLDIRDKVRFTCCEVSLGHMTWER